MSSMRNNFMEGKRKLTHFDDIRSKLCHKWNLKFVAVVVLTFPPSLKRLDGIDCTFRKFWNGKTTITIKSNRQRQTGARYGPMHGGKGANCFRFCRLPVCRFCESWARAWSTTEGRIPLFHTSWNLSESNPYCRAWWCRRFPRGNF